MADDDLLTMAEAAAKLRMSTKWLAKQVTAGKVPCTRLGRSVRFSAQNMADIVAMNHQPVKAPVVGIGAARSKRRAA